MTKSRVRPLSVLPRPRAMLSLAMLAVATLAAGCGSAAPVSDSGAPAAVNSGPPVSSSAPAPSNSEPSAGVQLPPTGGRFSYQIGGAYAVPAGVTVLDRDRTAPSVPGTYSICYVNAFQAQADAVGWWKQHHNNLLLRRDGNLVIDRDWHEPLLDLTQPAALSAVIGGWLDDCARSGYQAVEADNLDSYTRSDGQLSQAQALAFGRLLTARAHRDHLAIGQKNAAELSRSARSAGFDFAIAEECQVYSECNSYTDVYGPELIEIEYTDQDGKFFNQACAARGSQVSVVRRDRDVTPAGDPAHVEQWC